MIKITDKYYADNDKYNWILCEKHVITEKEAEKRKNVQAGDTEYKNISYHMTLQNLLENLFEKHKKIIAKNRDLKEYLYVLKDLQKNFLEQIKKIGEINVQEESGV